MLGQAAGLPVPASPESLTTALASTGWSPAGATTTPFCRTWALGGARAVVATAGSGAFLDVVPYTIAPGWDNPEFRAAVESDFATELDRLRSVAAAALAAVAERRPEAVPDGSGTSDFLESRQWDVRDWRLSVGIDYVDEDLPIMVVARLEPR